MAEIKVRRHKTFVSLVRIFRGFVNAVRAQRQDREIERFQEERKLLLQLETMAIEKSERILKAKVLKGLAANVKVSLEAKEIERDHL